MKVLFVLLSLSLTAVALGDPVRGTDGILRYHLGSKPPVLRCPVSMVCDIALLDDDQITDNAPPVAGDMEDFDIKVTAGPAPHIFIVALHPYHRTNLTVITTARVYHFFIWSIPNTGQTSGLSIGFFPVSRPAPVPVVFVSPQPAPQDSSDPINLSTLNCDAKLFSVTGSAPFRPLHVCLDSVRTYIQIVPVPEVPALVGIDAHGDLRAINYGYHDGFYIVAAQYPKYRLILGTGKDEERVDIARR